DFHLERHAVAHASLLTFLLIVLMLQADRLAAIFAEPRSHVIKSAALVAKRLNRRQRIYFNRRAAVLAVRAQIVQALEATALALPVADLIFDEIERCRT